MEIDALGPTGDLEWQLMHNENGYYESAKGFHDFIETLEDSDVDWSDESNHTPESILDNLSTEERFAMITYIELIGDFAAVFGETIEGTETVDDSGTTPLESYLGDDYYDE